MSAAGPLAEPPQWSQMATRSGGSAAAGLSAQMGVSATAATPA